MTTPSRRRRAFAIAVVTALGTLGSCIAGTPRLQDASAPRDFYKEVSEKEAACDRPVQLLPAGTLPGRRYRELASLSATCSPGSVELCDRRLKERACALGADAVLLGEGEPGASPAAIPMQSLVSRNARALKWQSP
ncbi:MAG TPA: hypothetical protein VK550_21905 [Polyangiaceae bacterium]|nr:hypothetical protein [Polyangiaceae bacterium]